MTGYSAAFRASSPRPVAHGPPRARPARARHRHRDGPRRRGRAGRGWPPGHVVAADISPSMLEGAGSPRRRVERHLRGGGRTGPLLPGRHFDAVLCSLGLMFFPDTGARPRASSVACSAPAVARRSPSTDHARAVLHHGRINARHRAARAVAGRGRGPVPLVGEASRLRALFEAAGFGTWRSRSRCGLSRSRPSTPTSSPFEQGGASERAGVRRAAGRRAPRRARGGAARAARRHGRRRSRWRWRSGFASGRR